jgi:beta-aspartyl-peptidase (threonine type)
MAEHLTADLNWHSAEMTTQQDQESIFSFSFHGGAGVIPRGAIDSGIYQDALNDVLSGAYSFAESNLENSSIKAIDVAEHCVKLLEDNELFNAGKGAVFTANGTHEMEASIMDGSSLQCGAVSMIMNYQNPISLARLVMEKSAHVYLVGDSAESLAAEHGMAKVESNSFFSTVKRFEQLQAAKGTQSVFMDHDLLESASSNGFTDSSALSPSENCLPRSQLPEASNEVSELTSSTANTNLTDNSETGTVGCVCFYKGDVASATSTGGMTNKRSGRVGDTPIIGAGTYANNQTCAVSCTGKTWTFETIKYNHTSFAVLF